MLKNTKLKEQIEKTVPAIFVENDEIFNQSEIIKHPKSKEDYQPEETKIEYSISTIKTNIDWLNDLQNFIDSLKTDPRYKKKADEIRTLESLQDILNQPENLEILQTDKNWSKFNWDHVKENLKFIMEIIVLICTIIDLPLKDFITLFQPSEKKKFV